MYWSEKGENNTTRTIELAINKAKELGIKYLVVASNSGSTAKLCLDQGLNVICVSHHVGFKNPGEDEMSAETRQELQAKGVPVLTATHLMAGLDRAVRNKFGGLYPAEIVATSLRMLGQGVKVGTEIAGMALDAGLIPYGEEVVAIAGSSRGADSAIVIQPAHSNNFFDTKIKEIICKPREF
ncbi:MAG: pyruvate kinase alpha/beta domain-containing protein [Bacillota bacterium]